jgi:hypothetical protein
MTEENEVPKKEKKPKFKKIKLYIKNMTRNKANQDITIVIKVVVLVLLTFSLYTGTSIYNKFTHQGPSCSASSFNYWIKAPGKIVSIHENKIQSENGTTDCYGTFERKSGNYANWKGSITSIDGSTIGNAKVL